MKRIILTVVLLAVSLLVLAFADKFSDVVCVDVHCL